MTIDTPNSRTDLGVRKWPADDAKPQATPTATVELDLEAVALFTLDSQRAIHVDLHGQLVAAIEIVSPRNKDRPAARDRYLGRYLSYTLSRRSLVARRRIASAAGVFFRRCRRGESFVRAAAVPTPFAVSYQVGDPVPNATILGSWRRAIAVGGPLPVIPLALTGSLAISIDLEHAYMESAKKKPSWRARRVMKNDPAITYFRAESTIIGPVCLSAVFGMGTGVSTQVWSPGDA